MDNRSVDADPQSTDDQGCHAPGRLHFPSFSIQSIVPAPGPEFEEAGDRYELRLDELSDGQQALIALSDACGDTVPQAVI